jgi:hypothetical protein
MVQEQSKIDQVIESTLSRRRSSQAAAHSITQYANTLPTDYLSLGMTRSDLLDRAERQRHCGDAFVWSETDQRVVRGHYCQNPAICPICAHRVQSVRHAKYAKACLAAARTHAAYHIVLTQRSRPGEPLAGSLGRLRGALRRFYLMGQRNRDGSRRGGEWGKVAGGLRGIEVKRGSGSGEWHAHAHALVFCSETLDLETITTLPDARTGNAVSMKKISVEWLKATHGESHDVHVQGVDASREQSVVEVINETLKYTVWGGGTSEESRAADLAESLIACHGRRFFEAFGMLRGIPGDDYEMKAGAGPFILYHHSDPHGYVPVACVDELPTVERSAMQQAIARVVAAYRSARCKAVKAVDVISEELDKMKHSMRAACSQIVSASAKMRGSAVWTADEHSRIYRAYIYKIFVLDVDPCPAPTESLLSIVNRPCGHCRSFPARRCVAARS